MALPKVLLTEVTSPLEGFSVLRCVLFIVPLVPRVRGEDNELFGLPPCDQTRIEKRGTWSGR